MSSKKKKVEQFLQISVHTDMKSTKEASSQQKNPKINPFVTKSLLESNCKRFRQSAIRKNFNLKRETQLQKTHSNNGDNYTNQYNQLNEKLQPVSLIYV